MIDEVSTMAEMKKRLQKYEISIVPQKKYHRVVETEKNDCHRGQRKKNKASDSNSDKGEQEL